MQANGVHILTFQNITFLEPFIEQYTSETQTYQMWEIYDT